jgi:hypothetical protein
MYTIYCGTTVTSNNHVVKTNGTDTMIGLVVVGGTTTSFVGPIGGTNKNITMSGTTTGGVKGSIVYATDIASGIWQINAFLVGAAGTMVTPMS